MKLRGRRITLTVNYTWSGRGQSGSFSNNYLLKPSASPPVHLHVESNQRLTSNWKSSKS